MTITDATGVTTKIRWCEHTWNPITGCTKISPGCDNCYAHTIATSSRFAAGFPMKFEPRYIPDRLAQPERWRAPSRVFANSMSDMFHGSFSDAVRDEMMSVMVGAGRHDFLVLTKRPGRMARYLDGWLMREGLGEVPANIWVGASVETDSFCGRADALRQIPATVRFLSCEPLLGPLPSLCLDGIGWVIVGGESGAGYRTMDHEWARDIRDMTLSEGKAFFFKQSSHYFTERGTELDGETIEQYPFPHPGDGHPRILGQYEGRTSAAAGQLFGE